MCNRLTYLHWVLLQENILKGNTSWYLKRVSLKKKQIFIKVYYHFYFCLVNIFFVVVYFNTLFLNILYYTLIYAHKRI